MRHDSPPTFCRSPTWREHSCLPRRGYSRRPAPVALPPETRLATRHEWALVDQVEAHIRELEIRIRLDIGQLGYVRLLKTLPGVGEILAATIYLEIGEVGRFGQAGQLAS